MCSHSVFETSRLAGGEKRRSRLMTTHRYKHSGPPECARKNIATWRHELRLPLLSLVVRRLGRLTDDGRRSTSLSDPQLSTLTSSLSLDNTWGRS